MALYLLGRVCRGPVRDESRVASAFQSSAHTVGGKYESAGAEMAFSQDASTLGVVEKRPDDRCGGFSALSSRPKPNREDLRDAELGRLGRAEPSVADSDSASDHLAHSNRKPFHEKSGAQAITPTWQPETVPSCPNSPLNAVQ